MKAGFISLLLAAALVAGAQAQNPAPTDESAGSFSISPSRREVVATPPVDLVPTRVSNTTPDSIKVRVFPVLLRQKVDGSFDFEELPAPLRTASKILTTSVKRFTLDPGGVRDVLIRWQLLPRKARAAYVGIVFQGTPPPEEGRPVNVITRLLSVNFLSLPGKRVARGRWLQLNASQFGEKVLRFVGRLRNTGNTIESPTHARLLIKKAGGGTVFQRGWRGDVVLPRAERDFIVDVKRQIPPGDYEATLVADFGRSKDVSISESFTLTGPNQLPTAVMTVDALEAHGDAGDPVSVSANAASTGSAPASTTLTLELFRLVNGLPEKEPVASEDVEISELEPGDEEKIEAEFGELEKGPYRVVGTYVDQPGSRKSVNTDFAALEAPDIGERFGDFLRENGLLFAILVAIAVAALVGGLMWRRQKRLEEELEQARETGPAAAPAAPAPAPAPPAPEPEPEPEPEQRAMSKGPREPEPEPEPVLDPEPEPEAAPPAPAPSAPGLVNVNTASVEELIALPGVGRKAAERIVAYRDEYGDFGTLLDLSSVEGFDAARIRRLTPNATT